MARNSSNVTSSAKRGLIADPNCTYLETRNLTCERETWSLTYVALLFEDDSLKPEEL